MSKSTFAAIIKAKLPEVSRVQIDAYWEMAHDANLPAVLFNAIVPSFHRLPTIHDAYVKMVGFSPLTIQRDQARRLILELLIEGSRYMSEIIRLFTIPAAMRQEIMEELIRDDFVCWKFCPIGNCISYDLNRRLLPKKKMQKRIHATMRNAERLSLYRLSMCAVNEDYFWFCLWARSVFFNGSNDYEIAYKDGAVIILNKAGA